MDGAIENVEGVKNSRPALAVGFEGLRVVRVENEPGDHAREIRRLPLARDKTFAEPDRPKKHAATKEPVVKNPNFCLKPLVEAAKNMPPAVGRHDDERAVAEFCEAAENEFLKKHPVGLCA